MLNPIPLRAQFPALGQKDDQGRPFVFFDGPGGTQVPQSVIDAVTQHYVHANANTHGYFTHSLRADVVIEEARQAMADFLNAASPQEIVFGPSATNLVYNVCQSMATQMEAGDEVIVTRLDHDANVAPWLSLQEQGVVVRYIDIDVEDCTLLLDQYQSLLNEKTKLVAVGWASNAVGTVNPIADMAEMAHEVGAKIWVDAVHYAPHFPIDVQAAQIDYLMCSVYKFFGPHLGVLWGRYELLEALPAYKVRPVDDRPPDKFERGTGQYELWAGTSAAIDYLGHIGQAFGQHYVSHYQQQGFEGRALDLKTSLAIIADYERELTHHTINGLKGIKGLQLFGIDDEARYDQRTPTLALRMMGKTPEEIARSLADHNIAVWDGDYYALEVVDRLGLADKGGMVRVGFVHYNTISEIDQLLNVLADLS